jgi:hypothetical protein
MTARQNNSKGFSQWCIALQTIMFLDLIHYLMFLKTRFGDWILFPSSGEMMEGWATTLLGPLVRARVSFIQGHGSQIMKALCSCYVRKLPLNLLQKNQYMDTILQLHVEVPITPTIHLCLGTHTENQINPPNHKMLTISDFSF